MKKFVFIVLVFLADSFGCEAQSEVDNLYKGSLKKIVKLYYAS